MSKNKTLSAAKSAKNDEFYTQYADIQKEINAYLDYDLNVGDGGVWRYLASDATGGRGRLVFFRDARGRAVEPDDFGLDVVRDANGVRQVLTPSRLADVVCATNGYDVRVYAVQSAPPLGPDGLYAAPSAEPERTLSVRRGADDRELFASFATKGGSPRGPRWRRSSQIQRLAPS